MAATATSSLSSFKRALVICVFLCPFTCYAFSFFYHPVFQIVCPEVYVKDTMGTLTCEADEIELAKLCGEIGPMTFFLTEELFFCESMFNSTCNCETAGGDATACCEKIGTKTRHYCYFNATVEHNQSTPYCRTLCEATMGKESYTHLLTNSCAPLKLGTAPPPTTAPPPPTKQESNFSLLMAILIPCAVAAFIGLVLLMVWRKRRHAQRDVEANPEGERKETPQGEGDENREGEGDENAEDEGDEDAEEAGDEDADAEDAGDEDAEGEVSEQPEESSEGGEQKTEEE